VPADLTPVYLTWCKRAANDGADPKSENSRPNSVSVPFICGTESRANPIVVANVKSSKSVPSHATREEQVIDFRAPHIAGEMLKKADVAEIEAARRG
jgi:hypothetical protein